MQLLEISAYMQLIVYALISNRKLQGIRYAVSHYLTIGSAIPVGSLYLAHGRLDFGHTTRNPITRLDFHGARMG